jgi:hypothetical protein
MFPTSRRCTGGIQARLLTVLTSPGTAAQAAPRGTGFLCIENPDRAAANVKNLLAEAGISPLNMVPWNACPWFTEEAKPTASELEAGVDPWIKLMALLPDLGVIMLLGGVAQGGWRRVLRRRPDLALSGITVIITHSPGPGASAGLTLQSEKRGDRLYGSPSVRRQTRSDSHIGPTRPPVACAD